MTRTYSLIAILTLCAAGGSPRALCQTGSGLRVTATVGSTAMNVTTGAEVPMAAPALRREVFGVVALSNTGPQLIRLSSLSISGTGEFTMISQPALPLEMKPGESTSFSVRYVPSGSSRSVAQAAILYSEAGSPSSVVFALVGTAPDIVLSYYLPPDGGVQPLAQGSRISFPAVNVRASRAATVIATNRGSAPGVINGLSVTGQAFQTAGTVTMPRVVSPAQEFRFDITFTPVQVGTFTGNLWISVGDTGVSAALEGAGIQPEYSFSYTLESDNNARMLSPGGRLAFAPTVLNSTSVASVSVRNDGASEGLVRSITVAGEGFVLRGLPLLPARLAAGASLPLQLIFTPRRLGSFSGTLRVDAGNQSAVFALEGNTASAEFSLSYVDPSTSSVKPLADGGSLVFTPAPVNSTQLRTVMVTNRGEGAGIIQDVSVAGEGFQPVGLPAFPLTVPPSTEFRFQVRFAPDKGQEYAAVLRISVDDQPLSVHLEGVGVGSSFAYEVMAGGTGTPLAPGGTLRFPDAAVGEISEVILQVRNTGNADAQIADVRLAGSDFRIAAGPFLPAIVRAGEAVAFRLEFVPLKPGRAATKLRIGSDEFELTSTGIGALLEYALISAGLTSKLAGGAEVVLPPAAVGNASGLDFSIENKGTRSELVASISLALVNAQFQLKGLPNLPFELQPGGTLRFSVAFLPATTGAISGLLRVNTVSFPLSGTGLDPVPLPEFHFSRANGQVDALQQPAIGLSLAEPYALPLKGTVTLSFVSDVFSSNAALQFATGGRVANFSIPAGSTEAVFENSSTSIRLQSGTVAGNITITPAFATLAGLNLTPASPRTLTLSVDGAPPRLVDLRLAARSGSEFVATITGYVTTRSLKDLDFTIGLRNGDSASTTTLKADIGSAALLWFQSAASEPYGGLFAVDVSFVLRGGEEGENLVGRVESFSVKATSELGTSNLLSGALR